MIYDDDCLAVIVSEAYKNAVQNGYDLDSMTADEIADDMITFDSDLEGNDFISVVRMIKKLRDE